MTLALLKPDRRMTIEAYLAFDEAAEQRHEFHDGEVLAMSGGTYEHGRVTKNLNGVLYNALRGHARCEHFDSNTKVLIQTARRFVYPDATVVCGPPQFLAEDRKRTAVLNPKVIFEVLSDSTEAYDRGAKFLAYQTLPTLDEYVLLNQKEPLVETRLRQSDGRWLVAVWQGRDAVARLESLDIELPLGELYALPPEPPNQDGSANSATAEGT